MDPAPPKNRPRTVDVIIEVPRGSFIKRELQGNKLVTEYVSPLPCLFNYGCSPDLAGGDGDPQDVVVLGPRLDPGSRLSVPVVGLVRFVDAGRPDNKLVASRHPTTLGDRLQLEAFFRVYVRARRMINVARGLRGSTEFRGVELFR